MLPDGSWFALFWCEFCQEWLREVTPAGSFPEVCGSLWIELELVLLWWMWASWVRMD